MANPITYTTNLLGLTSDPSGTPLSGQQNESRDQFHADQANLVDLGGGQFYDPTTGQVVSQTKFDNYDKYGNNVAGGAPTLTSLGALGAGIGTGALGGIGSSMGGVGGTIGNE